MTLLKSLRGFLRIDTWISQSFYLDWSMLLHSFVIFVTWGFSMLLYEFCCPLSNKTKVNFVQWLLKLLLWTKDVEWAKVLNALDPLCVWQYFNNGEGTQVNFKAIRHTWIMKCNTFILWQTHVVWSLHLLVPSRQTRGRLAPLTCVSLLRGLESQN